jgi:uncharacterized protein (DUF362 family)
MNRRAFLKWQLASGLLVAGAPLLGPGRVLADTTPDVAHVTGDPAAATRASVELLGGMGRFVKPGQRVVVKPNMSFPHGPEKGTNTHPEVVSALVGMCKEAGAGSVLVLDNPLSRGETCIERSGILAACEALLPDIVQTPTSSRFYTAARIENAKVMDENRFMTAVLESDVLICAATAKSHSSAGVSLSMKNLMGLIQDRGVMHRIGLDEAIVDLTTKLTPALSVVDAQYVLTTGGPFGPGKVDHERAVIASADPVAADAQTIVSFEWYGRRFRPDQVRHVALAAERGLGSMDMENMRIERLAL